MGGPAIASLLFGDAVPSGKLTVSFPRVTGQIPIYYNHMNTGRPSRGGAANITETVQPEGDTLSTTSLAFHNGRGELVTEPGLFHVWVAPDSARGLRGEFRLIE